MKAVNDEKLKRKIDAHRLRLMADCRPRFALLGALFLLAMILAGCNGAVVSRDGPEVEAPFGFMIYCQTYPSRVECGGDK